MFVSSGGGTVYTTDLKSVGASLTSSNLVWRIWVGSSVEEQCPFKALVVGSNPTRPISLGLCLSYQVKTIPF